MSACPSLPISLAAVNAGHGVADPDRVPVDLLAALAEVADPRAARGVRHRFVSVLAVGVGAVLGGARSYTAIAEWAHDLPVGVRVGLGLARPAPSESTIRRTLQAVDAQTPDQTVSAWLATRPTAPTAAPVRSPALRVIAIDGKSARGARGPDGRAVHLLAAFDHTSRVVLGQSVVDRKTNEITAFAPLLDRVEVTGAVITADALHTQRAHAEYPHERGAHYVLTVKRNQPGLHAQLATLPWAQVPEVDLTRDKGHGRVESRSLKLATVGAGIGFPHARLAIRLTRRRRSRASGRWHTETVYAVTDLSWGEIRAQQLAEIIRRHWSIENRLHWIRDVVFDEDHSQIRTSGGPAVMATLRNLVISVHRLAGATNIAAACRHVGRHPNRILPLIR